MHYHILSLQTQMEQEQMRLAFKMVLNQLLDIWYSWFDADISKAIKALRDEFQGVELQDSNLNIHAATVTSNGNSTSSGNGKGVKRKHVDQLNIMLT